MRHSPTTSSESLMPRARLRLPSVGTPRSSASPPSQRKARAWPAGVSGAGGLAPPRPARPFPALPGPALRLTPRLPRGGLGLGGGVFGGGGICPLPGDRAVFVDVAGDAVGPLFV